MSHEHAMCCSIVVLLLLIAGAAASDCATQDVRLNELDGQHKFAMYNQMVSYLEQCKGFKIVIVSLSAPAYVTAQRILRVMMSQLGPGENVHFRHRCSSNRIAYLFTQVRTSDATDTCHNTLPTSTDPPMVFHMATSFIMTISRYLPTRAAIEVLKSSAGRSVPKAIWNARSIRLEGGNGSTKCTSPLNSATDMELNRDM